MKVSLNIVKRFTNVNMVVDELVDRINQQLGGVEEVIDIGIRYEGVTIVKIVECNPIEGTDHLNATKIDDGGAIDGLQRDENGLVQVVCGAPNVRAGMLAAWIPPGCTVPSSIDDPEPFVLGSKELRGVLSNGMLASPKELAFGESHDGIMEIDPEEWNPNGIDIRPGTIFAEAYGLNDYVIDIENKMFTHRPDCFGNLGVAREIAGILHQKFTSPVWSNPHVEPTFNSGEGLMLSVQNDIPDKVPRFMAVAIKDIKVAPSPIWLQAELVRLGSKPINNIVDVTNYAMLLTAQPMHAYDYDKVATGKLGVRAANEGEKLTLLGGKEIELHSTDIVITDGQKPIGLGGVMGGVDTEVSGETKNIILECANFDMYTLRRTSMRHGLFTDAASRFTKGQSPLQNPHALKMALQSIFDTAGGEQASSVIDEKHVNSYDDYSLKGPQQIGIDFINNRLGLGLNRSEIESLLSNVEFDIGDSGDDNIINYVAPFWRTDIDLPEDVVEEVGRLFGFDKLPHNLPQRTLNPSPINPKLTLKRRIREALSRGGANEVLTYSFVHKAIFEKAGQDSSDAYQLSNALSPDLHYFRLTVLPSLLDKIHANIRAGYDQFALFEIGKGHKKSVGADDQGVPFEQEYVALALAGDGYYRAKALLEFMAKSLNLTFDYYPLDENKLFEPQRSAVVVCSGQTLGIIGEYRATARRDFKLPEASAGFELDLNALLNLAESAEGTYRALSRYPSAERDITFKVAAKTPYRQIKLAMDEGLQSFDLDIDILPLDIYQPEQVDTKNVTLRISMTSHEKTLSGEEVADVMEKLSTKVTSSLGAIVV